jgi:hypothetical protein
MESDDGFRSFSRAIETDPIGVLLAKWRRDVFIGKLKQLPDVADVIPSGSLARGTQIGPVHDVDLIVVFKRSEHPDYGSGRESAQDAMTHLENKLLEQLHPWRGGGGGPLKETEQQDHVVTYRGDSAGPFAEIIPSAPPVDVMPAVREGSHLLIPERGNGWIDVDPEKLMRQVEQRQREWKYFTEVVKMVKAWAEHNHLNMRNLAIEVMVLKYCPRPGIFETLSCGEAVARFFKAAANANITSLKDPAGRCGAIKLGVNYLKLQAALARAAGLARQAMDAEHAWKNRYHATEDVTHPDEFWRKLFGRKYPRPRERFWRAPSTEPWFDKYTVESPISAGLADLGPKRPGGAPKRPDHRSPDAPGGKGPERRDPVGPHGGSFGPSDGPNEGPFGPYDGPNRGPFGPYDGPNEGPSGPGDGPRRPSGGAPGRPDDPRADDHPPRRPGPTGPPEPMPAEPGTSLWTGIFSSAAVTVSVPLTFG